MNSVVKFVVLAAVVCAASAFLEEEFDAWAKEHGKVYESEVERAHRMKIYARNKEKIEMLNAQNAKNGDEDSEVYGVNAFSDQTEEELNAMLGSIPTADIEKAFEDMEVEEYVAPVNLSLPASFNWVDKGAVTGVKNQLQCGSCWAFAAVGVMEAQYFRKKKDLIQLSPQNLVDCDHDCVYVPNKICNNACKGGLGMAAFQHVIRVGINTLDDYRYTGVPAKTCKFNKAKAIKGFTRWTRVSIKAEDDLRSYIYKNGPVSVSIHAEELFNYKSGVFSAACSTQHDHEVLLTGWGKTKNGKPYWIIKNSWGTQWGINGYLHMIRGKNKCGITSLISTVFM